MIRAALTVTALLLAMLSPSLTQAANEIAITADTFTISEAAGEAVFTGKVAVVHPTLKLWANEVVVQYGEGGTSDIKSFVATGKVRIENATQKATGDRAVFDPSSQILRLSGNVMVENGPTLLAGPELIVDLANNTSTFSSGGTGGRVTGIFTQ